jgi:hypothetical protein
MRSLRKKFSLLLFGCLLSLGLGEIIVRVVLAVVPPPPSAYWQADADCGYRMRAGSPETLDPANDEFINSLGFRDREREVAKPADTFRILGIGDSFVYGAVPPRQNFLQVAEYTLNAAATRDGRRVDIPLLGCPGWSVENELGLLRTLGLQMQPDLVLINFFVGNDVTGIPVRGTVIGGDLHFNGSSRWWLNLLRKSRLFMLTEKSVFVALRQKWVARQFEPDSSDAVAGNSSAGTVTVNPEYLLIQRRNLPVYAPAPSGRTARLWQEAEQQLLAVDALCREAGVPWLLVVIPTEIQVAADVRAQVLQRLAITDDAFDVDLPQRRLRVFAAQHDLALIDLLPSLRAAHTPSAPLYVPNNTHWNERGNALVGQLLADHIAQRFRSGGI